MVSWRACTDSATNKCGALVPAGTQRCAGCAQKHELKRGRPAARGYDTAYRRAREKALDGATHCFRCGEPFTAENPATGGHLVAIADGGTVADGIAAECRLCNYGRKS